MADNTTHESITEVVPQVLADYLKDKVDAIRETFIDFPEPNLRLNMPSISVSAPSPSFEPTPTPYIDKKTPVVSNQSNVNWVVGDYEFSLQLDLWCGNKEELDDVLNEIFDALNPQITPMGLNLVLEDYFGTICSYLYTGHTRGNSEEAAQRDEWRMTLTVLATCKAIRTKKEFIIETTDIDAEINAEVLITEEL